MAPQHLAMMLIGLAKMQVGMELVVVCFAKVDGDVELDINMTMMQGGLTAWVCQGPVAEDGPAAPGHDAHWARKDAGGRGVSVG
jgi:hypothetical protein